MDGFAGERTRRPALALAYLALLATLIVLGVAITVFGDPQAGGPRVLLDIPIPARPAAALLPAKQTVQARSAPSVAPPPPPVTISQPVYAGRALVADPALIEATRARPA